MHMTEPETPDGETGEPMKTVNETERRPRLVVRLLGLALVTFSVFVATYLIVAYFAVQSGRTLRDEQEAENRTEQIDRQLELARQNRAEGSDNLALTRVEYVLSLDPDNAGALALREELVNATPPPTAASAEPTAEATPAEDTTDVPDGSEARPELQAIRRMVSAEQWEEALPALLTFQQLYPDYERAETNQMLYDTYIALGLKHVNSDNIELGLNYFSQAERLGDLPQEALDYRVWANLYFEGVAYSGVNWQIASGYWRDLCAAAPFFKNACNRLDVALEGYGDQLAFQMEWCPAVQVYQEAWNRRPSQDLEGKLNNAVDGCALATPVPITGTNSFTGTAPITGTTPLTPTEPGG